MDTSGFYRLHEIDGLQYAPNFVFNKAYSLVREDYLTYTYPVEGWYWFDNQVEAYIYFGIPVPEEPKTEV